MKLLGNILSATFVLLCLVNGRTAAGQETVIHQFLTGADGAYPEAGLIMDSKGDLFGTASGNGDYSGYADGTVFELIPTAGGGWRETVIYDFADAVNTTYTERPDSPLIADAKGNLYGTTRLGGLYDSGTAFELSPGADGSWTERTIYTFGGYATDGNYPRGGLIVDARGNLYGTTSTGGENIGGAYGVGDGTVFELMPTAGGTWTEKVLYNFGATTTDGIVPEAGLVMDSAGNLYGTTFNGGTYALEQSGYAGGTVYKLTPEAGGAWTEQILYNFDPNNGTPYGPPVESGYDPVSNLLLDGKGNLYGTAYDGGTGYAGTVFELSLSNGGAWTEKVLLNFFDPSLSGPKPARETGSYPQAGVTMDTKGNLYGTTVGYQGGATVFELMPQSDGSWTETVLHDFPATVYDGAVPAGGVILDSKGILYGTTSRGGALQSGTVYEIGAGPVATPTETMTLIGASGKFIASFPIALSTQVIPVLGEAVPTGTVTFIDPAFPGRGVTVPLDATGVAAYNTTAPRGGTYSLLAHYNGGTGFDASNSTTITMTVAPFPY